MIVEELLATLGVKVDVASFTAAEGAVSKLKVAAGAFIAALGINQLKEMVHSVAEVGDAANKSSMKLGLTAETLQELGYAAKLADVSQGQLEGAMFRLSKGMEKMSTTGKGPAADALRKLHISAKELKGGSLDANLEVIADAFAKLPDGSHKAALAMQLFGGAGKAMIPFLNGGSQAIREQREEARKLGIVIDNETAKKFEEFNDDQTRVSEAWRGMKVRIVSDLLPALHAMTLSLLDWLKANGEWIRMSLGTAIELIASAFGALGTVIGEVTTFVRTSVDFFREHTDVAIALASVLTVVLLPALISLMATLVDLVVLFATFNAPLLIIVGLITGIVLLVNHWGEVWGFVSEKGAAAFKVIRQKAGELGDWIVGLPGRILDAFSSFGSHLVDAMGRAFDAIVDAAKDTGSRVLRALEDVPVLGKIVRGGEAVVNYLSSSPDQEVIDQIKRQQLGVDYLGQGGGSTTVSNTFGPTSVTVHATTGADANQIGEIAATKTAEAQQRMVSDAYDTLKGGRR